MSYMPVLSSMRRESLVLSIVTLNTKLEHLARSGDYINKLQNFFMDLCLGRRKILSSEWLYFVRSWKTYACIAQIEGSGIAISLREMLGKKFHQKSSNDSEFCPVTICSVDSTISHVTT